MQLQQIQLIDLCPSSIRDDPQVIAICAALQPEFDAVTSEIDSVIMIPNLENQPDEVLEHLAWERNLDAEDGWLLADTRAKKISLIRQAYEIQRYKGTRYAVKKALELVGLNGIISEWYEYGGAPYWFKITIDGTQHFTPEQLNLLDRYVIKNKNTRSWCMVMIATTQQTQLNIAAGLIESNSITFFAPPASGQSVYISGENYYAASVLVAEDLIIGGELI